jgi:hypothetical protein
VLGFVKQDGNITQSATFSSCLLSHFTQRFSTTEPFVWHRKVEKEEDKKEQENLSMKVPLMLIFHDVL